MKEEILLKLKTIEKAENIKIIVAVESGSRAWGFASKDSDYDVRFIYVRQTKDYLKLNKARDVLEYPIDELLDIVGFDLEKTLNLLLKTNPSIFEWLKSPIVYVESELLNDLKLVSSKYYSSKKLIHHYIKMAEKNYQRYLHQDEVNLKKYFYSIRPLLSAKWIATNMAQPPIEIHELMKQDFDKEIKKVIIDLLETKKLAIETENISQIKVLNNYILEELKQLKVIAKGIKEETKLNYEPLNDLFFKALNIQEIKVNETKGFI